MKNCNATACSGTGPVDGHGEIPPSTIQPKTKTHPSRRQFPMHRVGAVQSSGSSPKLAPCARGRFGQLRAQSGITDISRKQCNVPDA